MSRMTQLDPSNVDVQEHPEQAALFAGIKKAIGKVPNAYAAIATHNPAALAAIIAADQTLSKGSLSRAEQELVKLIVSQKPPAATVSQRTPWGRSSRVGPLTR